MLDRRQLEQAIAAQEGLRGVVDDAIIDTTIAALRTQVAALEPPREAESRRILATILFMDLVGHTGLVQGRDPEEIMEIVDEALQRLAEPVTRYGGRIVRYQGDGFKAIFGVPVAQENDPDNAVRAALDILATVETIAAELTSERGLSGFRARVGIDTGLVVVGGGTEGEDAVTGLPVNLAARLESAASPGTVLVSHYTYQHIRGAYDMEALEPLQAKGFDEPVPVYRVLRVKPRTFRTRRRGVENVATRMIAREAELGLLQGEYRRVITGRESRMVLIVGEAGLGKSRLLYEFETWADLQSREVERFRGRARLETQTLPFGLWRDLFAFRWVIHDDDPMIVVADKILGGMRRVVGAENAGDMEAHLIGHLLGFDFAASSFVRPLLANPAQLRDQALYYLTAYFRAAVARAPVLILLEDLHWADEHSLDAIEMLTEALDGESLLILGATRPTLFERHPGWMERCAFLHRIDLSRLTGEESGRLVGEILQRAEHIPDRLRELIVTRAEGNPFYVEELVRMLIDEGVIVKGDERWTVHAEQLSEARVPATLAGVLQARLSGLPAAEREALQRASVVGRLFWDAAVEYVAATDQQANALASAPWATLERREIIFRHEESAFEGAREYVFNHALLHDVTYESVLRRLRREYHHRAAEWLIHTGGERVDEYAEWIAAHYARAEDGPGEAHWQTKAGQKAAARFALAEALAAFDRALLLTPDTELGARFEILQHRERVYNLQSSRDRQASDLDELERLAELFGEPTRLSEIARRRATFLQATGRYQEGLASAEAAHGWAKATGDLGQQAKSLGNLGMIRTLLGDFAAGVAHMQQGLALAQRAGDRQTQMDILRMLGVAAEEQGDLVGQSQHFEEALALARELHDRWGERRALNSLGVALGNRGQYAAAREYYEESLAIARSIGDRVGEGIVLGNLGVTASSVGDYDRAGRLFEETLRLTREIRDLTGENIAQLNLAYAISCQGETEMALSYLSKALRGTQQSGDRPLMGYVLNATGRVLLEAGRADEALDSLRQALTLREELGQPHLAVESRVLTSATLLAQGDPEAALAEIEPALDYLETGELETVEDLLHILWQAFQVLQAAGDARAGVILARAYAELQASVARLDEVSRQPYLENVAANRAILAAWQDRPEVS